MIKILRYNRLPYNSFLTFFNQYIFIILYFACIRSRRDFMKKVQSYKGSKGNNYKYNHDYQGGDSTTWFW